MRIRHFSTFSTVLIWIAFSLVGCSQGEFTSAEHLERAKDNIDKREFTAAAIELKNVLQKDPDSPEARWLMAKVAIELGDGAGAEHQLRRSIELGLVQQSAQPMLIKAIMLESDWDRVITETNHLAQGLSKEKQAMILGLRGQAYVGKGEFDKAKETLDKALEMDANSSAALVGMVAFFGFQRDYDSAHHWAEIAVAPKTAPAQAWSALGDVELEQEKYHEAEVAFTNAIELRHYKTLDQAKRAMARIQLKKFSEAEADILSLKQQGYEKHPYVNFVEGLGYFTQQKYSEALDPLDSSYRSDPTSLNTGIYLATAHLKLGNLEQALVIANSISAMAPTSRNSKRLRGAILTNQAEFGKAQNILEETLRNKPDDRMSLYMIATVMLLKGDTTQGFDYARRLALLEPESDQVKNLLRLAQFLDGRALDQELEYVNSESPEIGENFGQNMLFALEAFRNGNFEDALSRARLLHERYPNEVQPLNLMAGCYLALGNWVKAKIEFEKVLQIQPNEPSASINLAKLEAMAGKFEPARERLNSLLEAHPNYVNAILLLAEIENQLGRPSDEIRILEEALETNPNDLTLRSKLAEVYFREGLMTQVLNVTQGLGDLTLKEQPDLLALQGKAQLRSGDIRSAIHSFELWTKAVPESPEAHFFLAEALTKKGQNKHALEILEESLQLSPNYLPARIGRVKLLVILGDIAGAKEAMGEIRQDFGDSPDVLSLDGWLEMISGDFSLAVERFAAAAKQNPDTEIILYWAQSLWLQEKQEEALKVLQDWLQTHPRDLTILRYLAETYLSMDRVDQAQSVYEKIVEYYPNHVQALNNLSWLVRDQDRQQAIAYAERAYELQPSNPQVLDTLGMLLLDGVDISRGQHLIREAAISAPENLQIQLHLARSLLQQQEYAKARDTLERIVGKVEDGPVAIEAKELLNSIPDDQ